MAARSLPKPTAFRLYHWLWTALDWVFPPRCAGCEGFGDRWCDTCRAQTVPLPKTGCPTCGAPQASNQLCSSCVALTPAFNALRSYSTYSGPARKAILRMKYARDIGLGEVLSTNLFAMLAELQWPIDLVTCVPLSKGRMHQRGYNQAAVLARPLAMAIQKPFQPVLLRKTREAPSQVGLSAIDRRRNVDGAFEAAQLRPNARHILVIDDITTTGSTMNACARALRDAGAESVYGLTFARAGLQTTSQTP